MKRDMPAQTPAARLMGVLLRLLGENEQVCAASELLKHFPFASDGELRRTPAKGLRMQTTVHGAL